MSEKNYGWIDCFSRLKKLISDFRFQLCRIQTNTGCARQKCSCASLRRGRPMSLSRFLFILLEFFLTFVASKPYHKKHTGVLQVEVSGWQSRRAAWQFSPATAPRMQWAWIWNPFANMGLIPAALIWITDFSVSACVVPWAECAISDPRFLCLMGSWAF